MGDNALIITTYSIVRNDWKATLRQSGDRTLLHSIVWSRVVLDEGKQYVIRYFALAHTGSTYDPGTLKVICEVNLCTASGQEMGSDGHTHSKPSHGSLQSVQISSGFPFR